MKKETYFCFLLIENTFSYEIIENNYDVSHLLFYILCSVSLLVIVKNFINLFHQ